MLDGYGRDHVARKVSAHLQNKFAHPEDKLNILLITGSTHWQS